MVLHVSHPNNVRVYHVSGRDQASLPEWLVNKHKKSLKKDAEWRQRIELIQDFKFPEASNRIKMTPNLQHVVATGVYKPQVKVFDTQDLSLKFERHFTSENVEFEVLSDDWTKMVFLQNDRSIEFHAQGGCHYKTRIPAFGRDMKYHKETADLYVVGRSNEAFRLNLDVGQFMNPFETNLPSINAVDINELHSLVMLGGENGFVEFWDPRVRKSIYSLDLNLNVRDQVEVSSLKFLNDGLSLAMGTSKGHALLFDLRQSTPFQQKKHQYELPIINISHHASSDVMITSDKKVCKLWNKNTAEPFTSIEPPNDINDVFVIPDTGMIMMASESIEMQTFYVPSLGPAPSWASFLDNLTEELEEKPSQAVYDDYKFVTLKDLKSLNLEHLIGTKAIKAYMHGYFIDHRLYEKVKAIVNPFAYDEYVKQKKEEKVKSRISINKKLPKINRTLAQKLEEDKNSEILNDSRFADIFANEDFEIDEESNEYKLLHPVRSKKSIVEHFDDVSSDEDFEKSKKVQSAPTKSIKMYEIKAGESLQSLYKNKNNRKTFEERLAMGEEDLNNSSTKVEGNVQATFTSSGRGRGGRHLPHKRTQQRGVRELRLPKSSTKWKK
ncbi:WD40 repeat-like protein [Rozella allomycis CSF55]|uniref:WD40 repeat-like protein n=1 Tax=Rozella allomycis (strain CSF55) TaxID=988480 RepID=A0A075AYG2_ROZAC|nr:hypothetical protein O9G_003633 [Rozella allomycis CSF55]RKP18701.1 WD40 repeat-like protein [Rozella allomycis CSF55]|eukprot:EPZ35144.1 hypothetical protein O9G_003633 [Rozella allomycis CSF55]